MNRKRTLEELLTALQEALAIIESSLSQFQLTGEIYWLKNIAVQLRALIVYEPKSRSLNHPLLLELAKQEDFALTVFIINPEFTDFKQNLGVTLSFSANPLRLEKDGPYSHETNLGDAIAKHTLFQFEKMVSFKDIIRSVAEKEAAHYDTDRPVDLDRLSGVKIKGFPSEYQAIYYVGKISLNLGYRFLDAVASSRYGDVVSNIESLAKQKNANTEDKLQQAINSLQWILTLWTKNKSPEDYAETHYTLGVVYIMLADLEDSEDNLKRALKSFDHTLSVINDEDYPEYYAKTEYKAGLALARLGSKPSEFLERWRKAERSFRNAGTLDKAEIVSQRISEVERLSSK